MTKEHGLVALKGHGGAACCHDMLSLRKLETLV